MLTDSYSLKRFKAKLLGKPSCTLGVEAVKQKVYHLRKQSVNWMVFLASKEQSEVLYFLTDYLFGFRIGCISFDIPQV